MQLHNRLNHSCNVSLFSQPGQFAGLTAADANPPVILASLHFHGTGLDQMTLIPATRWFFNSFTLLSRRADFVKCIRKNCCLLVFMHLTEGGAAEKAWLPHLLPSTSVSSSTRKAWAVPGSSSTQHLPRAHYLPSRLTESHGRWTLTDPRLLKNAAFPLCASHTSSSQRTPMEEVARLFWDRGQPSQQPQVSKVQKRGHGNSKRERKRRGKDKAANCCQTHGWPVRSLTPTRQHPARDTALTGFLSAPARCCCADLSVQILPLGACWQDSSCCYLRRNEKHELRVFMTLSEWGAAAECPCLGMLTPAGEPAIWKSNLKKAQQKPDVSGGNLLTCRSYHWRQQR